jgi:hypothetical protein
MKTFKDILLAKESFIKRREEFLELNYQFYLNLIGQIGEKGQIPNGGLIKYKNGTRDNINIVEEWTELNDDESCSMQIGIITDQISHDVDFSTHKRKFELTLSVTINRETKEFEFDLTEQKPDEINFDEVVDYIFEELSDNYEKWTFGK